MKTQTNSISAWAHTHGPREDLSWWELIVALTGIVFLGLLLISATGCDRPTPTAPEIPGNLGDPGDSDDPGDDPEIIPGFDFTLETGLGWEYSWKQQYDTSSYGDANSWGSEGTFRITLGQPVRIAGIAGFEMTVSGQPFADVDRWQALALHAGRLLGSDDGTTWKTLFDATGRAWGGYGLFSSFPDAPLLVRADDRGAGVWRAGVASSVDNCETFDGNVICGTRDDETRARYDLFKAGVGPYGYHFDYQRSDWSTGGSSVTNVHHEVVLADHGPGMEPYPTRDLVVRNRLDWPVDVIIQDRERRIEARGTLTLPATDIVGDARVAWYPDDTAYCLGYAFLPDAILLEPVRQGPDRIEYEIINRLPDGEWLVDLTIKNSSRNSINVFIDANACYGGCKEIGPYEKYHHGLIPVSALRYLWNYGWNSCSSDQSVDGVRFDPSQISSGSGAYTVVF